MRLVTGQGTEMVDEWKDVVQIGDFGDVLVFSKKWVVVLDRHLRNVFHVSWGFSSCSKVLDVKLH